MPQGFPGLPCRPAHGSFFQAKTIPFSFSHKAGLSSFAIYRTPAGPFRQPLPWHPGRKAEKCLLLCRGGTKIQPLEHQPVPIPQTPGRYMLPILGHLRSRRRPTCLSPFKINAVLAIAGLIFILITDNAFSLNLVIPVMPEERRHHHTILPALGKPVLPSATTAVTSAQYHTAALPRPYTVYNHHTSNPPCYIQNYIAKYMPDKTARQDPPGESAFPCLPGHPGDDHAEPLKDVHLQRHHSIALYWCKRHPACSRTAHNVPC